MDHREKARHLVAAILTVAVSTLGRPAAAVQPVAAVVVIVPFADEVGMRRNLARHASGRLAELLSRKRVQVVAFADAESALREAGLRPEDLSGLGVTETFGRRLGADAVITGRLVRAETEPVRRLDDPTELGPPESTVTLAFRLTVVATRQVYFSEVTGYGVGRLTGMVRAADHAVADYVNRWSLSP